MVPLIYRVMEPADFIPVLDMLAETFSANAPLELAIGITAAEFRTMAAFEMADMVAQRLSIVAEDPADGKIVAVMAAHDATSPEPAGVSPTTAKYRPIGALINPLHEACLAACQPWLDAGPGHVLYFFVMGVRSGYQGQGIVKKVIERTLQEAQQRGFVMSCAVTTGLHATRAFTRLGFRIQGQTDYQDFEFQGTRPFLPVAAQGGAVVLTRAISG